MSDRRPAPFLPAAPHVAYLANLLTVLAVGYAAYYLWQQDRAARSNAGVGYAPDWRLS